MFLDKGLDLRVPDEEEKPSNLHQSAAVWRGFTLRIQRFSFFIFWSLAKMAAEAPMAQE